MNDLVNNGGPLPPAPHDWQKRLRDLEARALKAEAERDRLLKYAAHLASCETITRLDEWIHAERKGDHFDLRCTCGLAAIRDEIRKGEG